jgi:nucleoside-diphosphate-sugar epimerase
MSRVLVSGGVGAIGSEVVRRLLADPAYDVRVADRKEAPQWMREACEIRCVDLREFEQALAAMDGCSHVIHLASSAADSESADFSLLADSAAIDSSLLRAAVSHQVERFVYVSCACALEGAGKSAGGFAQLLGERLCRAASAEHDLPFAICRPAGSPPTTIEEIAAEIVIALSLRQTEPPPALLNGN